MDHGNSIEALTPVGRWRVEWDDTGITSSVWKQGGDPDVLPWTVHDAGRLDRGDTVAAFLKNWLNAYRAGVLDTLAIQDAFPSVFSNKVPRTFFYEQIWRIILSIPPGEIMTYSDVAHMAGVPRGARAVGNAMAANPWPVLIPCHRVVAKHSGLGGYSPGLRIKAWLLAWEQATYQSA